MFDLRPHRGTPASPGRRNRSWLGHARWPRPRLLAIALALLVIAAPLAAGPVAAQAADQPAFVVALAADGSAEITVRSTFDLTTDAEREAFRSLADDEQAQADAADRFLERLRAVASDAETATGREMTVTDAAIELHQSADGETGVVTLSATWTGLAATDGDTLVVTEPFASGFSTDRPVVLRAPDGYEVASTAPEPDAADAGTATWDAGTDLAGFAVELEPAEASADDGVGAVTDGQPGFGAPTALAAILGAAAVVIRRGRARRQ